MGQKQTKPTDGFTRIPPSLLVAMLGSDYAILCLNNVIRHHFLPSVCALRVFSSSHLICHDSKPWIENLRVEDVCCSGELFPRLKSLIFHAIGDSIIKQFVYTNRSVLTTLKIIFQKSITGYSTTFLHDLPPTLRVFVQDNGTFRVDPSKQIPTDIRGQQCVWPELRTLKLNEIFLSVHENAEKSFALPTTLRKLRLNHHFPGHPWYLNFPTNLISLELSYWDLEWTLPPNLRAFTFHYRRGSPETIAFPPNLQILRIKPSGITKLLTAKDDFSEKLPTCLRQLICPTIMFTNNLLHLPQLEYLEGWSHVTNIPVMFLFPLSLTVAKFYAHAPEILLDGHWYLNRDGQMSNIEKVCEERRKKRKREIMKE